MVELEPLLRNAIVASGMALFLLAMFYDWAFRIVPNRIPCGIAVLSTMIRALSGSLAAGLLAAMIVFALAAVCWRRGWLGGADVKLLGAGALLVSPADVVGFILATCLAGGVLALLYVLLGRLAPAPGPRVASASLLRRLIRVEQRRLKRRGPLPYATAIAFGACATLVAR